MSTLEIALGYIDRGWSPVPIPYKQKGPLIKDWQNLALNETTAYNHFNGGPQNVGVQLGARSHGLTDVDLDCSEALVVASYLLPTTKAMFGRKSKQASHKLYRTDLAERYAKGALQFHDPNNKAAGKATLLEVRIGGGDRGAQTVFPGSVHESGEPIEWENGYDGEALEIDGEALYRAARETAAASLIARYWPSVGARHDAGLCLGGFLYRCGLTIERIKLFAEAVAAAAGADKKHTIRQATDAAESGSKGVHVYGLTHTRETFGDKVANKIAEWLGYQTNGEQETETPAKPSQSDQANEPQLDPLTIEETLEVFKRWLILPNLTPVYAMLGTVAANLLEGDAVWLGIIGPPSSANTELLNSISKLPKVVQAATLTPAGLLSGTPKKQSAKDAKGGLLREIGDFGIISLKDFGSILSMRQDAKAEVLAALREIYDGEWTRHLGTDGGRTLSWKGKVGVLFGSTGVLDSHYGVIGAMGDRFLLTRLAPVEKGQFGQALKHLGAATTRMRKELADAVARLFAGRRPEPHPLSDEEIARLDTIVSLVVRLRGAVERDRYSREIEAVYGAEGTARIGLTLVGLLAGLDTLGVDRKTALDVVEAVAMDSVPPIRRRAYEYLQAEDRDREFLTDKDDAVIGSGTPTSAVAKALELPTVTVRRALEDLTAYGLVQRIIRGQGKPDFWNALEP